MIIISRDPQFPTNKRLAHELDHLGENSLFLDPYQSSLPLTLPTGGPVLFRSSGITYDDYDLDLAQALQMQGYHITNPIHSIRKLRDKLKQSLFLEEHDIPRCDYFCQRGVIRDEFIEGIEDREYIVKPLRGNGGKGIVIASTKVQLLATLKQHYQSKDQRYLIQPYISSDKEFRVFIIKSKFIGAIEKITRPGMLGNAAHCGDTAYRCKQELPHELKLLSQKVLDSSGAHYLGIDILQTQHGYIVIDVNTSPGLAHFEEISKINLARELIHSM